MQSQIQQAITQIESAIRQLEQEVEQLDRTKKERKAEIKRLRRMLKPVNSKEDR